MMMTKSQRCWRLVTSIGPRTPTMCDREDDTNSILYWQEFLSHSFEFLRDALSRIKPRLKVENQKVDERVLRWD